MNDPSPSHDGVADPERAHRRGTRSYHRDRYLAVILAAMFVVALIPFGTVHEGVRLAVAVVVALVAAGGAVLGKESGGPSLPAVLVPSMVATAFLLSLLWVVPVPTGVGAALMPTFGSLVDESRALSGSSGGPLALYPRGAVIGASFGIATAILGGAGAFLFRNSRRVGRLGAFLVATAVVTLAVAVAHGLLGLTAPWGLVGYTAPRANFFGPLVYPNDGGLLCAAMIPVALAVGLRDRGKQLVPFGLVAMLLAAGAWVSDSRAAVVIVPFGAGLLVLLRGPMWGRAAVVAVAALAVVGVGIWGPAEAILWLTAQLEKPTFYEGNNPFTGRPSIWMDGIRAWLGAPLGVGLRGFEDARRIVKSDPAFDSAMHAHQEPIESLLELGPVSLLLMAPAVATVVLGVRTALRRADDRGLLAAGFVSALCCLFAFALVDFPFRVGALAVLAALVGGAVLGLAEERAVPPLVVIGWRVAQVGLALVCLVGAITLSVAANRDSWYANPYTRIADGDGWLAHSTAIEDEAMTRAREHYLQGLRARPLDAGLPLRLARLEGAARHPDRARAWLLLAARLDPMSPFPWLNLARIARSERQTEAARDAWRHLLTLATDDPTWLKRAQEAVSGAPNLVDEVRAVVPKERWCLVAASLPATQVAEAEALFMATADEPGCRVRWAYSAHGRGDPAHALEVLGDARGCEADRLRVLAAAGLSRFAEANEAAVRALRECGPGDHHVRLATALARLETGDDTGYRILQGLLKDNPNNAAARRVLANAYYTAGRREEARQQYERLVASGTANSADRARLEDLSARP